MSKEFGARVYKVFGIKRSLSLVGGKPCKPDVCVLIPIILKILILTI